VGRRINADGVQPCMPEFRRGEMNINVLREEYPVARKDHNCSACEWIREDMRDFTFAELREIVIAKRNGWKIKKGQKYIKQINICDGDFGVYKAIPEIHDICIEHDMFEN